MAQASYDGLLTLASLIGVEVRDDEVLPAGYNGMWLPRYRVIAIDRMLPDCGKRCTLVHELIHASHNDTGCDTIYDRKAERRTRRETALRLINQTEYASAENLYGADEWAIACDLDVTLQVLGDYKLWLHDNVQPVRGKR